MNSAVAQVVKKGLKMLIQDYYSVPLQIMQFRY